MTDHEPGPIEASRPHLVLASGSPRRRELLARLGVRFTIRVPDVDERPDPGEGPVAYVERLARRKAVAASTLPTARPGDVVLAADTTVALGDSILGKPIDAADAGVMLRALSGRTHQVHTGVAVCGPSGIVSSVTTTSVTFRELSRDDIATYVATGDPLDKSGGYGIQGDAGRFVARLEGSLSNVVGLPMAQTAALLADAGLDTVAWGPPRSP
ncbi:MAG: Maf family protein [Acidimicrobiales bacterium]